MSASATQGGHKKYTMTDRGPT